MKYSVRLFLMVAGLAIAAQSTSAHFRLLEPASWLIESDRGDPQKSGPCGGSNTDWGKPSYFISKAVGGQKLHIKVQETVYHPGHYRAALAVNSPTELPPDPQVTTRVFQLPASFKCRGSGNWTLKDRPKAAGSSSSRIQRTSR